MCDCTITQGREGERGSWCVKCGTKVLEVHDRSCKECKHFEPDNRSERLGFCRPNYMLVTDDMHVTYYLIDGPGRYGLCFEPCATS